MDEYRIRVRIFVGVIIFIVGVLTVRLVQLQFIEADAYAGESRMNAIRENRVQPARGVIYDRDLRLMVDNEPSYTITLTPRHFNPDNVPLLARLLEVPDSLVAARLAEARRWSAFRPSRSFREVPQEIFARIQENQYRLPGVWYEVEQMRRYVTDARAAHALGYIREITEVELAPRRRMGYRPGDLIGKAGLERTYESYLRGRLGSEFKLVNIHGLEVKSYQDGREDSPPMAGYDLVLGIDSRVQALAESLFVNKRGGAVAIDPRSGEIIAMVSKPDFDPAIFSESVDRETWAYLTTSKDKPMLNRATMSVFPPGSTWKPFVALMGLAEGDINVNSRINCPGYHPFAGPGMFRCLGVHGSIGLERAMQVSCNTYFFEVMMRTDVNSFARHARAFGFGQRAPTDIGEQSAALIPDSSYFNRMFPRGWTAGYSINLGIGQGNMSVTPLQMANFMAAVANGGILHPPHLVRELVHAETGEVMRPRLPAPRVIDIDQHYFDVVREGMRLAMEAGTGRASQIPGFSSAGKTGTAQAGTGRQNHSVFIMYAPAEDPEIAIAVMVENIGFGGTYAAPLASLMAEMYLKGYIEPTPQRQMLIQRLLNARSQPLP